MSFSLAEIETIDQDWRGLAPEHPWTGWAFCPEAPDEVWIFRTRANWRHFFLRKLDGSYSLVDDLNDHEANFESLEALSAYITEVPSRQ